MNWKMLKKRVVVYLWAKWYKEPIIPPNTKCYLIPKGKSQLNWSVRIIPGELLHDQNGLYINQILKLNNSEYFLDLEVSDLIEIK